MLSLSLKSGKRGFLFLQYLQSNFATAVISAILLFTTSCSDQGKDSATKPLFKLITSANTGIDFENRIEYTEEFNTYTYRNFYNGAGVGTGDFNNDGLPDIYFCGNQAGNKLYINRGNLRFEDVTEKSGVGCSGSWSTGVSIADINGDGLHDIYVCKSGKSGGRNRSNELFINNGDLTFTECAAQYGLNITGLSNQAAFFDYDLDGDLDCYLLINSLKSVTDFEIKPGLREIRDTLGANMLLRNDGNHFTDVSETAGIYGSSIGFGLGVSTGDLNRDGWPDIYVSNDFFERDYLYLNNRNGTFSECLERDLRETSQGAMGSDIGDLNNDGWSEIFSTEMTAQGNARLKTKVLFDSWDTYRTKLENGYFRQFARNTLQLNNGDGSYSEISRFSGVSSTDWSWGALIMDLDNDGWKDIFVANGIYKDLLDRDFLDIYSNPSVIRELIKTEEKAILSLIDMIPSAPVSNYAFRNNRDLTFDNLSAEWKLDDPSFSNGAAYADLDNDGDLDLVVNNVNMPPFIYRNESNKRTASNYLVLILKGSGMNTGAIGSSVSAYLNGNLRFQELFPARGFQSTSDYRIHFGLGAERGIDSLVINWPGGKCTVIDSISANQFLTVTEKEATYRIKYPNRITVEPVFRKYEENKILNFSHRENDFNDFDRDRLLFEMLSNEGPEIAVADINGDGLDDIFICGAKDSPGRIFVQSAGGRFISTNETVFETDRICEDTDCVFFDADGDGDPDLYVASGGNEFPLSSSALADRLYINDGKGNFSKSEQLLPAGRYESTSCVEPADYDNDGDIDLFVGIRLQPFFYGIPCNGYLLENNGKGVFTDVTEKRAPSLKGIGMITSMTWADIDNDKDYDMVIVGDWMPVKILVNNDGIFSDESGNYGLANTEGWWKCVIPADLNNDGRIDFILGNHGYNSFFKATPDKPLEMYVNDFDINGEVEQIICSYNGDVSYPMVLKDDLVRQIPSLASRYRKYSDYKDHTMKDIFNEEALKRSLVLKARHMGSSVMINNGKGFFELLPLPSRAQFFPVYAIIAGDFNRDGTCDILLGGNQSRAKPQTGIYYSGNGLLLAGTADGNFIPLSSAESGIFTTGEIRDIKHIYINGIPSIVVARNNDNLEIYKMIK